MANVQQIKSIYALIWLFEILKMILSLSFLFYKFIYISNTFIKYFTK